MKKLITRCLVALSLLSLGACNYDKFDEPEIPLPDYSMLSPTHSIAELKALYQTGGNTLSEDIIVGGQVASDDSEGNFYRSLHIQDATAGIELKLGLSNLSLFYKQGQHVYVRCKGLRLGKYGDMVNLGYETIDDKYENGFLPDKLVRAAVIAGSKDQLEPKHVSIKDLSPADANTLISLREVQFLEGELGETWADPENKESVPSVNRTIEDRNGNQIIVRTSSYARFAGRKLPEGSGELIALLTYFRDTPQLSIIRLSDVKLTDHRF